MLALPHDTLELICAEKETAYAFGFVCKSAAGFARGLFHLKRNSDMITLTGKYNNYVYTIHAASNGFIQPSHRSSLIFDLIIENPYDGMICNECSGFGTSIPHVCVGETGVHVNELGIALRGDAIYVFDADLVDEFTHIRAAFDGLYLVEAAVMIFPRGDTVRRELSLVPQLQTVFLRKYGDIVRGCDNIPCEDGYTILLRPFQPPGYKTAVIFMAYCASAADSSILTQNCADHLTRAQ